MIKAQQRIELHVTVCIPEQTWQLHRSVFPAEEAPDIVFQGDRMHPGIIFDQEAVDRFLEAEGLSIPAYSEAIFGAINESNERHGVYWLDTEDGVTRCTAVEWELKYFLDTHCIPAPLE